MKKQYFLLSFLLVLFTLPSTAQITNNIELSTSINDFGLAPHSSAKLDIQSSNKGILIPRMTTSQRNAINSPATGLLVFDTSTAGFWFYNGSAWTDLSAGGGADTDWTDHTNGIYNNTDNVAIGTTPNDKTQLYIYRDSGDIGFNKANIYGYRYGMSTALGGGGNWTSGQVDAAVKGVSFWGNTYSAAIYGSSYLDYINSAAVLGVDNTGDILGALGYNNDGIKLAGYFKGEVRIKQNASGTGISFENHDNTTQVWRMGISSSTNNFLFYYNDVQKSYINQSNGAYTQSSDRTLKANIEYLDGILPKVMQLKPAKYYYKSSLDAAQKSHGFIAQEVQAIFPELVHKSEDGTLALAYDDFAILAIQAIKEQQAEIENQTQKNNELEQRLAKLEALLLEKE